MPAFYQRSSWPKGISQMWAKTQFITHEPFFWKPTELQTLTKDTGLQLPDTDAKINKYISQL